ncbi:unnamed protein product, partial [Meganyctiphanes norvegica]
MNLSSLRALSYSGCWSRTTAWNPILRTTPWNPKSKPSSWNPRSRPSPWNPILRPTPLNPKPKPSSWNPMSIPSPWNLWNLRSTLSMEPQQRTPAPNLGPGQECLQGTPEDKVRGFGKELGKTMKNVLVFVG